MVAERRTRAERKVLKDARSASLKRTRVTKGAWNYAKAVLECEAAGFTVHLEESEAHWNTQSIQHSKRKMLMSNGTQYNVDNIIHGQSSFSKPTKEQKKQSYDKMGLTRKERGYGQQHWMEIAAITAAIPILNLEQKFEFQMLPDGLGTDLIVRIQGTELWAPVQVKSAVTHYDEQFSLDVHATDSLPGKL